MSANYQFPTATGIWQAKITNEPGEPPFQDSALVCYMLEFNNGPLIRHLKLYVPKEILKRDRNRIPAEIKKLPAEIIEVIGKWLEGDEKEGTYQVSAEELTLWAWKKTYDNRHRRLA